MPQSNTFEAGTASIAELFGDYLINSPEHGTCIALVLGSRLPTDAERNALLKSLAALGYGEEACVFATLAPNLPDGSPSSSEPAGPPGAQTSPAAAFPLDAQALFMLIEGLDPLFVIAADESATRALGIAYRTEFAPDTAIRVFGRSSVAFGNLDALLATEQGKRKAWTLLKSIPKR